MGSVGAGAAVTVARRVGVPAAAVEKFYRRRRFGSLAMVIDVSSSMEGEVSLLKSRIADIESRRSMFGNVVVSTYGGAPSRPRVAKSSGSRSVVGFVAATRTVSVGACPQPSMSALADAVVAADRNSVLVHVTDSAASDARRKGLVACLSRYRNVRIFTVAIGDLCGAAYAGEFEFLAERTAGAVLRLRREHFSQLLEFIVSAEANVGLFRNFASFSPKIGGCMRLSCRCGSRAKFDLRRSTRATAAYARGSVSLGIVLDATGSMTPEYTQIRTYLSGLIKATRGQFDKFVLAEYNEPYEKRLLATSDARAALDFLDETFVFGGGDCPEPAFHAIRDVAAAVSPGSVVFLFTDASAKDKSLEAEVTRLLREKDVVLNVVSTGDMCRPDGETGDELRRVAASSGGRQLAVSKNLVKDIMEYIRRVSAYGLELLRKVPKNSAKMAALARRCSCTRTNGC